MNTNPRDVAGEERRTPARWTTGPAQGSPSLPTVSHWAGAFSSWALWVGTNLSSLFSISLSHAAPAPHPPPERPWSRHRPRGSRTGNVQATHPPVSQATFLLYIPDPRLTLTFRDSPERYRVRVFF